MKKIGKLLNFKILAVLLVALIGFSQINAAGVSANLSYTGPSSVTVGETLTVSVNVTNISGGSLSGFGFGVVFDDEYLEYESHTLGTTGLSMFGDASTYKFGGFGVGTTLSTDSTLVTLKFKALKAGSTTLSFNSIDFTDHVTPSPDPVSVNDSSKTITITEPAPVSTNANLASLGVTGYSISPTFASGTISYTLSVPNTVSSVTITASAEDSKATVSGTGSKSLNVGSNTATVRVTAEDGTTTKTYTITITRAEAAKSNDATLSSMSVSGYAMTPVFSSGVTSGYNVTVPNAATSIIVNAVSTSGKANVKVTGADNLVVGDNIVTVEVTAEDGTTKKTYTINVVRQDASVVEPTKDSDATLKSLYIGGYTLTPTFSSGVNNYTINVGSLVGGLADIYATPNSDKASVEIDGNLGWNYGFNQMFITVTAEDGTKNIYVINVNRKDPNESSTSTPVKSNDNYLSSLIVNGGSLIPDFDKDISNYNITLPYDIDKLDIKYNVSGSGATVQIIGNENFNVGSVNTVQIKVTAEDGSVRIYTINATRSAISANNKLKSLSISDYVLSPSFDKNTLRYSLTVKHGVDKLDIKAIPENESAKVTIIGNSLVDGKNVISIEVVDENGFKEVYYLEVTREESALSGFNWFNLLMLLAFLIGLGVIIFLIIMLLKRKNEKEDITEVKKEQPTINFNPEFNFGSKNGTDDDIVYPNAVFNQGNGVIPNTEEPKKLIAEVDESNVKEAEFDYFDDTITKDELIQAIKEGMETKNADKLNMLLKQDELNQLKKKVKKNEERE